MGKTGAKIEETVKHHARISPLFRGAATKGGDENHLVKFFPTVI